MRKLRQAQAQARTIKCGYRSCHRAVLSYPQTPPPLGREKGTEAERAARCGFLDPSADYVSEKHPLQVRCGPGAGVPPW